MLQVRVELDRRPLRYTFVSYRPDFGDPVVAMSDGDGMVGFGSASPNARLDIVVHAHNLAVRMLDGTSPAISEVALRFRDKTDGDTLNISPRNEKQFEHYVIMDRCYRVYETVFRPVAPFSGPSRRVFPFGGASDPAHVHRREPRVDCRFPEILVPGKLPWVQPQSITAGVPLMHLKGPDQDPRLFGARDRPATTIAHEYAHALHFSLLPRLARWELAAKYALWIGRELANGRSGTHRTDKQTSSLIAFIEAIGIFSQRFWLFATEIEPDLSGHRLRTAFVDDELSAAPRLADLMPGYVPIATRTARGVRPHLRGSSTEGAVYGAIFLDFADRTDLATSVNTYLRSRAFTAQSWMDHTAEQRKGRFAGAVDAVRATWRL